MYKPCGSFNTRGIRNCSPYITESLPWRNKIQNRRANIHITHRVNALSTGRASAPHSLGSIVKSSYYLVGVVMVPMALGSKGER
jgi:hypothetical protein